MTHYKTCNECKEEKPATQFYKDSHGADGYRSTCKKCCRSKWKKDSQFYSLFNIEKVSTLAKGKHRIMKVSYFGYYLGILIFISKKEILAYSTLKDWRYVKTQTDGKLFLYNQVIEAGKKIGFAVGERAREFMMKFNR